MRANLAYITRGEHFEHRCEHAEDDSRHHLTPITVRFHEDSVETIKFMDYDGPENVDHIALGENDRIQSILHCLHELEEEDIAQSLQRIPNLPTELPICKEAKEPDFPRAKVMALPNRALQHLWAKCGRLSLLSLAEP